MKSLSDFFHYYTSGIYILNLHCLFRPTLCFPIYPSPSINRYPRTPLDSLASPPDYTEHPVHLSHGSTIMPSANWTQPMYIPRAAHTWPNSLRVHVFWIVTHIEHSPYPWLKHLSVHDDSKLANSSWFRIRIWGRRTIYYVTPSRQRMKKK